MCVQLILTNMNRFNNQLTGSKALFQVDTLLAAPDVVLHPQANEVYKLTLQCVRDAVDGYVRCCLSLAGPRILY